MMIMEREKIDEATNQAVVGIEYDTWMNYDTEDLVFSDVLKRITDESSWEQGVNSTQLRVVPLEDNPLVANVYSDQYNIPVNVIEDTMKNTRLLLSFDEQYFPLRNSAMKSLLETAKISGNALSKVNTPELAQILNYCLEVTRGKSLLLHRAGKVSAVLSSDARGYGILPMDELYDTTKRVMHDRFGGCELLGGSVSHEYLKAIFKLPQNNKVLEEYKASVSSVYDVDSIVPGIILRSSDVGLQAATLDPVFIMGNKYWTIGNSEKLNHVSGSTMLRFEASAQMMFSKLDKTIRKFTELSKVTIRNPHNAFILACKKAKLPKKYGAEALEEFSMMVAANDISNAHDIYMGITEILFYAYRDGGNDITVSFLEDKIAKVLNFNWSELDLPGDHAW